MTLVQPSGEIQLKIRGELNENVATRDQDLEHIKQWLAKQPHLPQFEDDGRLMTFLRGCKFSLEKTKRKLDMYFTMRTAVPEFFSQRDPLREEIKEIFKLLSVGSVMPKFTENGRRVAVFKAFDPETPFPAPSELMKVTMMIGDVRLLEETEGVAGDTVVFDAEVVTPAHFAANFPKFTPTVIKKFLTCIQEAYPVKLKEIHVINVSPLVDTIINAVKPFLKEKIRERIHVHSTLDTLYKFVSKDILPEEYGGSAGPMSKINNDWYEKLVSYRQWFLDQENVKADESKRPGKPKTYDDLFGMEGSFKKLSID